MRLSKNHHFVTHSSRIGLLITIEIYWYILVTGENLCILN